MVQWVVGSILHWVDPLSSFSFQPVLHDWCNKGRGMCYPVCVMMHIKEHLLLIGKSSLCMWRQRVSFSLSEWSLTICVTPYKIKCVECVVKLKYFLPSIVKRDIRFNLQRNTRSTSVSHNILTQRTPMLLFPGL